MPQDIYSRQASQLAGVLASDQVRLQFTEGILQTLAQQLRFSYAQSVNQIYELGSQNIYYVVGRTQGQGSIGKVAGATNSVCEIYEQYGDACRAKKNVIQLSMENPDCTIEVDGEPFANAAAFSLLYVVFVNVDFSIGAQDMLINENTSFRYGSLECDSANN